METQKTIENDTGLAVFARGNGFVYAIRHFIEERLHERQLRRTAEELNELSDHLKADIAWPSIARHEHR